MFKPDTYDAYVGFKKSDYQHRLHNIMEMKKYNKCMYIEKYFAFHLEYIIHIYQMMMIQSLHFIPICSLLTSSSYL